MSAVRGFRHERLRLNRSQTLCFQYFRDFLRTADMAPLPQFAGDPSSPVTTTMFLKEDSDQWCQLLVLFLGHRWLCNTPGMKGRSVYIEKPTHFCDRRDPLISDHVDDRVHVGHSLRPKMAVGQVARGDCSPRAPTDPYVPALGHTAPHIRRSPRDVGRPIEQLARAEAGTIRAAD